MTIRLTDNGDKTILQAIFDRRAEVTITAIEEGSEYSWEYTAWFRKKPIIYEYNRDGTNTKEWKADLEFVCGTFEYGACPCDRIDGFETGAEDEMWSTIVADPYDIVTTAAYVHCGSYGTGQCKKT